MQLKFFSPARGRLRGLTLVETLVASSVFAIAMVGLVSAQYLGARYDQLTASKLGASESSRRGFDLLTSDIRSAKIWSVGNGDQQNYRPCGNEATQLGNAIQLHFSTDTNRYVRYFFDVSNQRLCRTTNDWEGYQVIAESLTNTMSFHAEKFDGTLAQDLEYKYVIVTTMEFAQFQYPLTRVGPNYYYNYYRMQFKTASHCPN